MTQLSLQDQAVTIARQPVYEALIAQRRELMAQIEALRTEKTALQTQMDQLAKTDPAVRVLDARWIELDERTQAIEQMLRRTTNDIVELGAIPGSTVAPPQMIRVDRENLLIGGFFTLVILLPISIAIARRIWRRSTSAVAALPSDLIERLKRMESAVDATAIEVERIGEGQRFLTKLMSDHMSAISENSSRAGFLERAKERASHSGTTPH